MAASPRCEMQSGCERPSPWGHQENLSGRRDVFIRCAAYDLWQMGERSRWEKGCCLWE